MENFRNLCYKETPEKYLFSIRLRRDKKKKNYSVLLVFSSYRYPIIYR